MIDCDLLPQLGAQQLMDGMLQPDIGIFNTLLEMCVLNHEWTEARTFLHMLAQVLTPDTEP